VTTWISAWEQPPPNSAPSSAGSSPSMSRRASLARSPTTRPDLATAQRFCRLLAQRGLLCLAWPEEFGGRGGSVWEQTVVREEMWAQHEPRGAQYMGVNWVGRAIMRHGTPAQQAAHLPPIAGGAVIWCQGFSEPDAGSDLASLPGAGGDWFRREAQDHWRYAQASTVASGSIEMQRILLARSLLRAP